MSNIELRYGLVTAWTTDLSDLLTSLGKSSSDITDIAFCLKSDRKLADEDAEVFLTLLLNPSNISLDLPTNVVTITLDSAFYTNLIIGKSYYLGLGLKFTGDTTFLELEEANNKEKVLITQDIIRE